MNLGLGNLAVLKAFVLPEALGDDTTFDARLAAIGKGAAGAIDQYCNRKFARVAGELFVASADRAYLILPRYPVESVSVIEQRDDLTTGFVALAANTVLNRDDTCGFVDFGTVLGSSSSLLRLTYTGGYFVETLEPTDNSYPTALPSGATALPEELQHAWLLQCQKIFERTRAASTGGIKEDGQPFLPSINLDGTVKMILDSYRRFA